MTLENLNDFATLVHFFVCVHALLLGFVAGIPVWLRVIAR